MLEKLCGNKKFLRTLIFLALPIILQELMAHAVNFMDMWMMGQLSLEAVTGVGLSKRLFFLFVLLIFGVNSGGAIFMGQYWGKGDTGGIHRVLAIAFVTNIIIAIIFACIALFAPRWFLSIVTSDPAVIEQGVQYLAVASLIYLLTAVSFTILMALRSIRQTKIPMFASACSLVIKLIINYVFVFVLDMGVVGAAWGTVFARVTEIIVQIILIRRYRLPIFTNIRQHFDFNTAYVKNFFKTALPVIGNEFFWALGVFMYDVAYQFTGSTGQGAFQISDSIQHLFMIAGISIGVASGVTIANHLGAGDRDVAIAASRKCVAIGATVAFVMGVLLFFIGPFIVATYDNVSEYVQGLAASNLAIISIFMIPRTVNYFFIISILRQGGDTMFCLILDTGSVWLIGIPLAFLGAYVLGWPIYLVLALVYLEEVVKIFIAGARVRKNRWANKLV
jgi:putative MATE family efflux protein